MTRLEKALQITAGFEGGSYDNLTGSFDGQGLSAGILQWNYGQGSLQPMLKEYIAVHGEPQGFPESIVASANMNGPNAVTFSMRMQDPNSKFRVKPEWKAPWKALLSSPEFVAIQLQRAGTIGTHAERLMVRWGLESTTAFCFFFDVCVQNGGMRGLTPGSPSAGVPITGIEQANADIWWMGPPSPEQEILLQALGARVTLVKPEFQKDVITRKMTILMQRGWVHGHYYDFHELLNG